MYPKHPEPLNPETEPCRAIEGNLDGGKADAAGRSVNKHCPRIHRGSDYEEEVKTERARASERE